MAQVVLEVQVVSWPQENCAPKITTSRKKKAFSMNAEIHPPADDTTRHTSQLTRLMKGTLRRVGWNDLWGGVRILYVLFQYHSA
jgi:hypothetical protein